MSNIQCPAVVKYEDKYYMAWKKLGGRLHLIGTDGQKYSGTPTAEKCTMVREFDTKTFNGHKYFKTKLGVYSLSTGNKIKMPEIVAMFAEKKMCVVCGKVEVDTAAGYDTCPACAINM